METDLLDKDIEDVLKDMQEKEKNDPVCIALDLCRAIDKKIKIGDIKDCVTQIFVDDLCNGRIYMIVFKTIEIDKQFGHYETATLPILVDFGLCNLLTVANSDINIHYCGYDLSWEFKKLVDHGIKTIKVTDLRDVDGLAMMIKEA